MKVKIGDQLIESHSYTKLSDYNGTKRWQSTQIISELIEISVAVVVEASVICEKEVESIYYETEIGKAVVEALRSKGCDVKIVYEGQPIYKDQYSTYARVKTIMIYAKHPNGKIYRVTQTISANYN